MPPPIIGILPLDSPRWKSFSTFFGKPEEVPQRVASWIASIGGKNESSEWNDLSEQFLHQCTITDAAFAAVPHLVGALDRVPPTSRLTYIADIALVEENRQRPPPELSQDLAEAYHAAIEQVRRLAIECLSVQWQKIEFRYLMSAIASLHGHGFLGEVLSHPDCLSGECPKCGEMVYPDEFKNCGYV